MKCLSMKLFVYEVLKMFVCEVFVYANVYYEVLVYEFVYDLFACEVFVYELTYL